MRKMWVSSNTKSLKVWKKSEAIGPGTFKIMKITNDNEEEGKTKKWQRKKNKRRKKSKRWSLENGQKGQNQPDSTTQDTIDKIFDIIMADQQITDLQGLEGWTLANWLCLIICNRKRRNIYSFKLSIRPKKVCVALSALKFFGMVCRLIYISSA